MSLRTSELPALAAPLALLASCGGDQPFPAVADGWPETIACGEDGTDQVLECGLDVATVESGTRLTIRQPDGGFRRIEVNGSGWRAADGAEPLKVIGSVSGGFDVRIGGWRYRLPMKAATP